MEEIKNKCEQTPKDECMSEEDILNDILLSEKSISNSYSVAINEMSNKLNGLLKELADYQSKTSIMTNRFEKFADVEESTQILWMDYKDSFNNLNTTITDGVENYTKNVHKGVNDILTEYDSSISKTIESLYKMVENLNEAAENMSDSIEELGSVMQRA